MTATAASSAFSDFPRTFKGPTFGPGDEGYGEVKQLWNARGGDQLPALIVQAIDTDDVVTAVDYAVSKGIGVAVRSGGHGIECFAMASDALVVDLSLMKRITVDPATGRTVVQAGALLGELNIATQEHGYVVTAGTVSAVGVGGLTLGGGFGHLTRRFGATVDNLLSVDLVTMDGRALTASKDEHAELFWGMRGAGQNLAIATSFTFQAHRVGPEMIGGDLIYATADAVTVLTSLNEAMARSPRELSVSPIVTPAPPMPGVPEDVVGKPIVLASVVYTGPPELYESAMREIRKLATPMADMVGPSTWLKTSTAIDEWMPSGRLWYNGGGLLAEISAEVAEIVVTAVGESPPGCEVHMPVLGGALHDFAENSAAMSRAGADWMYEITAQWDSPESDDEYITWVEDLGAALAPHTLTNGYVNLNPCRDADALRTIYGSREKWNRIVALKQEWDPENRLRYNKNIAPTAASALS